MNDLSQGWGGPLLGISQRLPPSNPQAEQALLGAIFGNAKALHAVVDFLRPEHFADPVNGRIYREASRRILAGGIADPLTLRTWFEADPDVEAVGGVNYLSLILTHMVSIVGAKPYGLAIHDCWQRRELIAIGEDVVNRSFAAAPEDESGALISSMIDRLDKVAAGAGEDRKAIPFNDAMDMAIAGMERAMRGDGPAGVSTGMRAVDEALGGLEPQTMTVLAGRPGMGKSALGMQWTIAAARQFRDAHAAGGPKQGVLAVSLEMSAEQLGRRALASVARVPLEAIKKGRVVQADVDRIVQARGELDGLPLSIEDCSGLSMGMIRLKARAAKRRHGGLGLIMVDHLHIVRPEEADVRNGATSAIGKISNGLKQLAKEFQCPVLALAQLSRSLESREDKRPTLNDLRQSGEIEQDADAVAFVYRGEYYLPKGEPERNARETLQQFNDRCFELEEMRVRLKGRAEVILEKVRDGSPRSIALNWHGATTHFTEPQQ
jgi:replicative DNA helicase